MHTHMPKILNKFLFLLTERKSKTVTELSNIFTLFLTYSQCLMLMALSFNVIP